MQDTMSKTVVWTGPETPPKFEKGQILEITYGSDAGKIGRVVNISFNRHNGLWVYTIRFRDLHTETFVEQNLKESTSWMI
jgi:ribosomal protein S4E